MEIKVKEVEFTEAKSVQERERELHEQHERQLNGEFDDVDTPVIKTDDMVIDNQAPIVDTTEVDSEDELSEEKVLSYLGKRYGKEINSFDDLVQERNDSDELDEEIATYLKYKKETGRGFEDFKQLNKDYDSMEPDQLLRAYLSATQEGLDSDDIDVLMDEYSFDEDFDDESDIKKIKLKMKKSVNEAKKFFNQQKEKYRVPLESSRSSIPEGDKEEYESYKQYIQSSKTQQEESERKSKWFEQKTDEVFGGEFKGFEFNIGEKNITFAPGDATELKKLQSNPYSFISKYLDEDGMMKDAAGYHRSLAMALNPEKFAKFFYEQGQSDATDDVTRKIKNINMSERQTPVSVNKGEMKVKAVNPDSGRGLKIRSIKNV
jgi:hypothetical protein